MYVFIIISSSNFFYKNPTFLGLLEQLCPILMASGVPADVLTEVCFIYYIIYVCVCFMIDILMKSIMHIKKSLTLKTMHTIMQQVCKFAEVH